MISKESLFINPLSVLTHMHTDAHTLIHQVVFRQPHRPCVNSSIYLDNKSRAGADGN